MFVIPRPGAGETVKAEELTPVVFTQEQSDRAWEAILRAYLKRHPEAARGKSAGD